MDTPGLKGSLSFGLPVHTSNFNAAESRGRSICLHFCSLLSLWVGFVSRDWHHVPSLQLTSLPHCWSGQKGQEKQPGAGQRVPGVRHITRRTPPACPATPPRPSGQRQAHPRLPGGARRSP